MKNDPSASSRSRQPRSIVRINGVVFTGCISWSVENNTFYAADTFHLDLSVNALPVANGPAWFASQSTLTVEIFAGFPANPDSFTASELKSWILGDADDVDWSLDGRKITLTGRDHTAKLIDEKAAAKYPNQTASQIATTLAAKYGLTPVVTATTTKVGKYYEIDHVRLQDERTEWDLLTWLAREEQFVVFVQGNELHFQPQPTATQDPYVFQYVPPVDGGPPSLNATTLSISRNLTLAKGIVVKVTSWNAKQKKGFVRKATAAGGSGSKPQTYSYTFAGLQPDQAQQKANQLLSEISKHQVKLNVSGPADNILTMTDVIKVQGTATAFDQVFYPDTISREFGIEDGYRWTIHAKNQSPQSEPNL